MTSDFLYGVLTWLPPVLLAIVGHEVAHGAMARELGDPTAEEQGRLSLNPIRHIDPVGSLLVPLALKVAGSPYLFGWARPVPVNWGKLANPRRDVALVAAAGPAANLLMLAVWILLGVALSISPQRWAWPLLHMVQAGIIINSALIVVNLVPIPPLDGSRIVSALLPPAWAQMYNRYERFGLLLVLVLLFTGVLGNILDPALSLMIKLSLGALG